MVPFILYAIAIAVCALAVYANLQSFLKIVDNKGWRRTAYIVCQIGILVLALVIMFLPALFNFGETGWQWILSRVFSIISATIFTLFASGSFERRIGRKWETATLLEQHHHVH
jgi:membrane protein YdbS with pleckstrin-like domain